MYRKPDFPTAYNDLVDWRVQGGGLSFQDWLNRQRHMLPVIQRQRRNPNNQFFLEDGEGTDPGWPTTQGSQDLPILPYPPPQVPPGFPEPLPVPVPPGGGGFRWDLFGRRIR